MINIEKLFFILFQFTGIKTFSAKKYFLENAFDPMSFYLANQNLFVLGINNTNIYASAWLLLDNKKAEGTQLIINNKLDILMNEYRK